MRFCPIICFALVVLAVFAGDSRADDAPASPKEPVATLKPKAAIPPRAELERLLKQLGHERYEKREAASRKFLEIGLDALPLLEKQEKNADREIRFRCRRIAALIRDGDLEERLRAFVEGAGRAESATLPGWRRFRPVVGDSRQTRQMYAAMLRLEDKLLRSLEAGPESTNSALLSTCQQLLTMEQPAQDDAFALRVATFLFVAGLPDAKTPEQTVIAIYSLCLRPGFQTAIQSGPRKTHLKKLLSRIIEQEDASSDSAYASLTIAMMYDLSAGLAPAKRVLQANTHSKEWLRHAIVTVAKLGEKQTDTQAIRELLARWLDDDTVFYVGRINQQQIRTTIGDVALAGLVLLVGEAHDDYGFEYLRRQAPYVFAKGTCGFDSEEKRRRAVMKWRSRSK